MFLEPHTFICICKLYIICNALLCGAANERDSDTDAFRWLYGAADIPHAYSLEIGVCIKYKTRKYNKFNIDVMCKRALLAFAYHPTHALYILTHSPAAQWPKSSFSISFFISVEYNFRFGPIQIHIHSLPQQLNHKMTWVYFIAVAAEPLACADLYLLLFLLYGCLSCQQNI